MPYISRKHRPELDMGGRPSTVGELTYVLARIVDTYLLHVGPIQFDKLGEAITALECTKLELYRRIVAPYEDTKIKAHGEVFESL